MGSTMSGRVVRSTRPSEAGLDVVVDVTTRQAREMLRLEAAAISAMADRLDERFAQAVRLLHSVRGHVVVIALGKSGHVARKVAATMASTGTPSFFVHATEALHGDLGMITEDDAVLMISHSGETSELLQLLPHLRERGIATLAMVGTVGSRLARGVELALDVSVEREVCPHNLAPTSSVLVQLAMGDALTLALMRLRKFREEDFARLHPGGNIGRRLERAGDAAKTSGPVYVSLDASAIECIGAIATSEIGLVLVRDGLELVGVITAAELGHALSNVEGALRATARELMSHQVHTVDAELPTREAEQRMRDQGIPALVVVDRCGEVVGVISCHRDR